VSKSFKKWKPKTGSPISQKEQKYYFDFPTEPIGGGNPYYCCKYCKRSVPEINGQLNEHHVWCEYRIIQELGGKL